MKRFFFFIFISLVLMTLVGCNSLDKKTETKELANRVFDVQMANSHNLSKESQIAFYEDKMEWKKQYDPENPNRESSEKSKIAPKDEFISLENVTIQLKNNVYLITGNEDGKEKTYKFKKISENEIEDESKIVYEDKSLN